MRSFNRSARRRLKGVRRRLQPSWRFRGLWLRGLLALRGSHPASLCEQTRFVFVVGSGRSGTQFLSGLLNTDPHALVLHEPDFTSDVNEMPRMRRDPQRARAYVEGFRKYSIFSRVAEQKPAVYGEVSGTIRYCIGDLERAIQGCQVLIIARDLRDIVRSVMARGHYRNGAKGAWAMSPEPSEPYYKEWPNLSRFSKVCWGTRDAYETLFRQVPQAPIVQLEKAVSDWDYVRRALLEVTGFHVRFEDWRALAQTRSPNATRTYSVPHWTNWSHEEQEVFKTICGSTMVRLGYWPDGMKHSGE